MNHGGQRRGVFDVDEDRALEVLRLARGGAYDIGHEHGRWITARRGGAGETLSGETPDDLNRALRVDWAHGAVP